MSLHEHIPLPVFTCLSVCTVRRGNKSFERCNLLSKRALFVPRILSTCPLHLSPAILTLNLFLYFSLYHSPLPGFFSTPPYFTLTHCMLSASPSIRRCPRDRAERYLSPSTSLKSRNRFQCRERASAVAPAVF